VYHNRWISKSDAQLLLSVKVQGYTAFISYYIVRYLDFGLLDGILRFKRLFIPTFAACFRMLSFEQSGLTSADIHTLRMSYGLIKGVTVGAYFAIKDYF